MAEISDVLAREVAGYLTYAADHLPLGPVVRATPVKHDEISVADVMNFFEGLPEDHPLRRVANVKAVREGYGRLSAWGYSRDMPAEGLGSHIVSQIQSPL